MSIQKKKKTNNYSLPRHPIYGTQTNVILLKFTGIYYYGRKFQKYLYKLIFFFFKFE